MASAGLRPGGRINALRRSFLAEQGIPLEEIEAHRSTVFDAWHARSDLILVAELWMKTELLTKWPELRGRVMTIRGFLKGFSPENEVISSHEAHIEDTAGHTDVEKIALYVELEGLAKELAERLLTE